MKKIGLYLIVGFLFTLSSCKNDNEEDLYPPIKNPNIACDTSNLTYENFVKPLFEANCTTSGCHDGGSGLAGYTNYQSVLNIANSGSLERRVLTLKNMPPMGALSDCDQQKLRRWLMNAMPEK